MAYQGNQPALNYISFAQQTFTIVNSQTAYTLDHSVSNGKDILLYINNVKQIEGSSAAYTASGTTLTLSSALTNGTDTMYCVFIGKAVQTVNPPSGSVGSSQVAASIISGQTALGATPADTDELLISDAGTLKRVDFSHLKSSNAPVFYAYESTGKTLTNNAFTKITFDEEVVDADGIYDTSNSRVTFGETGRFVLAVRLNVSNAGTNFKTVRIYRNGSGWRDVFTDYFSNDGDLNINAYCLLNNENTTDYYEVYVYQNSGSDKTTSGGMHAQFFAGYKIIE